ncbi:putative hemagluttinin family protein [Flavobacterium sp. 9AF]|uniref:T9SS-dependent choice-of-anchor J family protein n=1 Tax=Flavobacterium sp. 9AF TaxID=2653142 RepID=UPI0012F0A540|nr:T9SS type A sorting domain-containing protein [Flavobacterium sp. 9AF]VXB62955.1 putative hemagluttinin family protein [Flavobacterium sp. 9AF]
MKKTLLLIKNSILFLLVLFSTSINAQSDYYDVVDYDGGTSGNARAPQGSRRYARSVYLIPATEINGSGIVSGDVINGIVFTYLAAQDITTTGNLILYLENTSDTANNKSTTWTTAITGMTTVSNSSLTIPNTIGDLSIPFSGGSPFTYTGGGLYVAFDYSNVSGAIATTNATVACNSTGVLNGLKGAQSNTAPPTTTTASSFRPITKLGKSVSCARPIELDASNATLNSATLSWNGVGGSDVEIEYGVYGFTQGTGTILSGVSVVSPYNLTGLSPSSVYDFYIRTNCGGGNYSAWNGPFSFNTIFEPTVAPYNTSFEQESFPFLGWKLETGTPAGSDWQVGIFGAGTFVQDGIASVYSLSGVTTAAANNWVISRGVNLTAGSTVTVSFYVRNYVDNGSTGSASYNLAVGNAQTVASQTTPIGTQASFTDTAWTLKTYTFTPSFTGAHYFGVQNTSPANTVGRQALFMDNFSVSEVLSVDTFLASKFKIYPNPINDIVSINSDSVSFDNISILDINGRTVKQVNVNAVNQFSLNISELNSGIYFLKVKTKEGIFNQKIIKK